MDKKLNEKYWVDCFNNQLLKNTGQRFIIENDKGEKPDFEIVWEGRKIGIEVTELYQDDFNTHGGSKFKQDQRVVEKFTDLVIKEIQKITNINFVINLRVHQFKKIRSKRSLMGLKIIAEECARNLIHLKDLSGFSIPNFHLFPDFIESIYLFKYDSLFEPFNGTISGGVLSKLSRERLQLHINNKEKKLEDYKPMDQHWLLLAEGEGFAGSFSTIDICGSFFSSFDRVYLYRAFQHELIELKVQKVCLFSE